jgi:Transposase, Mutator family
LDGTFLKGGNRGVLLLATFKDPNNSLHILAVAHALSESFDNWNFFLSSLAPFIDPFVGFVISDREKGLQQACALNFTAPQFFCQRHVMANLKKKFKLPDIQSTVWQLINTESNLKYNTLKAILESTEKGKECWNWINDIGITKLSRVNQLLPRFGVYTTNNIESINSRIREFRKESIINCFLSLEKFVQTSITEKLVKAGQCKSTMTSFCEAILSKNEETARSLKVEQTAVHKYIVKDKDDKEEIVSTNPLYICSCFAFKSNFLPCCHIIAICNETGTDIYSIVDPIWLSLNQISYFEISLNQEVVLKQNILADDNLCHNIKQQRGRPRKRRIESQYTSRGQKNKCTNCLEHGHNLRSCRNPRNNQTLLI